MASQSIDMLNPYGQQPGRVRLTNASGLPLRAEVAFGPAMLEIILLRTEEEEDHAAIPGETAQRPAGGVQHGR